MNTAPTPQDAPDPPSPGPSAEPALAPFVEYLARVCTRPGPRAQLRRSLGREPHEAHTAHAYVAPFLGDRPSADRERAMYCVAALFARFDGVPRPPDRVNFGRWLGQEVKKGWETDAFEVNRNSIERRLYRVARMSSAQIRRELPLLLSAAGVERPSLDWDRLILDLSYWDNDPSIAKQWLQGFHQALGPPPSPESEADEVASSTTSFVAPTVN